MSWHSRLAPSSAYRWVECPLSVSLSEEFPALMQDPSGPEGTAAHWVWYSMIKSHTPVLGELTPEGIQVTQEMLDGALQFVNKVFAIANPHQAMRKVRLEERSSMTGIHWIMFGTPDAEVDLLEEVGEYHLIDYKYGHRSVDPFENWQLAAYAFGAFERLQLTAGQIDNAKVFFHIVQPRCYHNRPASQTWETTGKSLRRMWDRMRESANEAITLELAAYPSLGPHCRDCPGRRACPTFRTNTGANIDWINRSWPNQMPLEAAGVELSFIRGALEQLKAAETALSEQVEYEISQGGFSPHWALESTPGRGREWNVPVEQVIELGEMVDTPLTKKPDLITPSQAIDLFKKKGFDTSLIAEYSVPKKGAVSLKPKTDTLASRVFGAKNNGMA